jgi:hypothetical protein
MKTDLMEVAHMPTRCDEQFVDFDTGGLFGFNGWIVQAVQF